MKVEGEKSGVQYSLNLLDVGTEPFVNLIEVFNRVTGVKYRGMIAVPYLQSDLGERQLCMLLDKIHGHLSCLYNLPFT